MPDVLIFRVAEQEDPPGIRCYFMPGHYVVVRPDNEDADWVRERAAAGVVFSIGAPTVTKVYRCATCDGHGWTQECCGMANVDGEGSCSGDCSVQVHCPDCLPVLTLPDDIPF